MRPQQQNRRMRGRNNNNNSNNNNNGNNNRKGPNPLTRNYESNGPDVKIRGSAQQIAEKYTTLARDAQSSGDRVMAENYLQHAEHYNRIIAAAQAQMPIQHVRDNRDDADDDMDDEQRDNLESGNTSEVVTQVGNGSGPQPVIDGVPAEVALNQEAIRDNGGERRERQFRERLPRERQVNGNHVADAETAEGGNIGPVEAGDVDVGNVEAVAGGEAPGTEAVNGEAEEAAPRRPRRPRRPRSRPEQDAAASAEGESVAAPAVVETPAPETPNGDTALARAES